MLTFLAILHVFIGLGLIAFVLLQDPKGGAAGIFGGGSSSNTFFGASGASNFLSTTTKWLAGLFAISCLILTAVTSSNKSTSVLDQSDGAVPTQQSAPPADPGAATPGQSAPDAAAPAKPATPPAGK